MHTFSGSLQLLEEREGLAVDASVDTDAATLRLKGGGSFYAPSPIRCVAVHWPRIAAVAASGELVAMSDPQRNEGCVSEPPDRSAIGDCRYGERSCKCVMEGVAARHCDAVGAVRFDSRVS